MVVEQARGERGVALGDRLDHGFVLPRGNGNHVEIALDGLPPVEIQLVHHASVVRGKRSVAGRVGEQLVKLDVEREIGVGVALAPGGMHPLHDRAHALELRRLRAFGGEPADLGLERCAHLVDFVRLLERHQAHEDAPVLFGLHKPRLLERAKRLAHRAARNPHGARQFRFVQLRTGRKLACDDAPLNLALHERCQRLLAHDSERLIRFHALTVSRSAL